MKSNEDSGSNPKSREPEASSTFNYIGMTRTSAHSWMLGHLQGQKARTSANPLHRHDEAQHGGVQQEYSMRILAQEQNLLPLCVREGLFIEKQVPILRMNERNESGRG